MTEAALEQAETFDDEDVETQRAEAATAEPEAGNAPETAETEQPASDTEGAAGHRSAERRIAQLTAKYRSEQRRNQEMAERLERLESRLGPEPGPPRPQADDFETTEEYEDALFAWNDERRAHATQQDKKPPASPALPDDVKQNLPVFDKQVQALATKVPDATAAIFNDDWPCTDEMMQIIVGSDRGAELAYHLATNHAEAERIANLSPLQQARELTKIEAGMSPAQPKLATSRAPAPPNPVTPRGSGDVDPDKMTADEWRKWRQKSLANRNS